MQSRVLLLTFLFAAAAGCTDNDSMASGDNDGDASNGNQTAGSPVDYRVMEVKNLTTAGFPEETWDFQVKPNATEAHATIRLEALTGGDPIHRGAMCVKWNRQTENGYSAGSEGDCGGGGGTNIAIQIPPAAVALDWQNLVVGNYSISLNAEAQPNRMVVDILVDYPQD